MYYYIKLGDNKREMSFKFKAKIFIYSRLLIVEKERWGEIEKHKERLENLYISL